MRPGTARIDMVSPFLSYYNGNGGAKFPKKFGFDEKFERMGGTDLNTCVVNGAECRCPKPLVKRNVRFWGKECSLILHVRFP